MNHLNQRQQQAMEYTKGPLIIVAGAGTGKTTVITQKIAYLIEQNLAKPEEILALAFNDKAAEEIQARVDQLVNIGYVDIQISTFHAFGQRLLEEYGLEIGLSTDFKILTDVDAWILVRKNLDKFKLDYYQPLGNPAKHIHELIKHFSKCKDELISPSEYLEHAENVKLDKDNTNEEERSRLTEIANAYHVYNQLLLDHNVLDFGDLIYYSLTLLKKRSLILKSLQQRFKYILVDEFQDVNWAQYQLVKLLAGKNSQLTIVGDDDQSIYAFRNASVANILRFKDDYPKSKEILLTVNYRSGQNILDQAYKLIQNNNPDRLECKLKLDKKLKAATPIKAEVVRSHQPSLDDEVKFVVQEIIKLKEQDKQASWDDFAILVRANSQATPFIKGLEDAGLPYEFLAASGLYRQPIILDCLNFFQLVNNYHESSAIYRLLRLPPFNLTEEDMQKITYLAKKKAISYYEALKQSREFSLTQAGVNTCEKLKALIQAGSEQARALKPHRVLYNFLADSGYLKHLTHELNQGNRAVIRQTYQLTEFFERIKKYEESMPDAKAADFMEQFEYLTQSGDQGSFSQPIDTPDSINIITVHRAKGLEYKYVFVVNLVEDRFPSRRRGQGIDIPLALVKEQLPEGDSHLQEERRLFYVACTRAKAKLYLTSASDYGGARTKKISRFLLELGYKIDEEQSRGDKKIAILTASVPAKGKLVYEIPKIFSYTQLKAYDTCHYQYQLGYIIKLPIKQTHYFSFGNTIHNTLQEFYKRVQILNSARQESLFGLPVRQANRPLQPAKSTNGHKAPELKELLEIYEQKWSGDWYLSKPQKEKYFAEGKKMLKIFYQTNSQRWTVPVALESKFTIKISDWGITGRLDRVDQLADGSLEIIDYKTGASKTDLATEDKDQLILYQLAAESLSQYKNIGAPGKLTLYFIKDNIITSFLGQDKDKTKLTAKLTATVEKIRTGDFTATPSQHICQNCHFRDICEFKV